MMPAERDGATARAEPAESAPAVPRDWRHSSKACADGDGPRERAHPRQRRFVRIEHTQREQRQHRRQRERGPFGERPRQPAAGDVREPRGAGREQRGRIDDEAVGMQVDVTARVDEDLVQAAAHPPQQPHAAAAAPISGIHACHARASPRPCSHQPVNRPASAISSIAIYGLLSTGSAVASAGRAGS